MPVILRKPLALLTAMIALHLPQAFAETLNAQATYVIHESDMSQWINDQTAKWLVPNQVIANQVGFVSPFQSQLQNVSWQGVANLNWTKDPKSNIWVFDGSTNNLTVLATSFSVHDLFPVTVNGQIIKVRVDADCQNLTMNVPGQWVIHGEIPVSWQDTSMVAPVQNFTMTPSSQVPTVKIASCTGPAGMEPFLNQQLAQLYKQPDKIQSAALNEVQLFINGQISNLMSSMGKPFSFSFLGVNVSFTPTAGSSLPNGSILLDGPLVLQSPNGTGVTTVAKDYSDSDLSDARASGFGFAVTLLRQIVGFVYQSGLLDFPFGSDSLPAFQSFMQDRTEQLFVWQDLWNFATNTVFNFDVSATSSPTILSMQDLFPGVQLELAAPLDAVMSAPTAFGSLPYVEFYSSPTQAQMQLNFLATKKGSLQVKYSLDQLALSYGYRPEFFRVRQPTMTINTDAIAQSVMQSYQNQVWTYTMPDGASPIPDYRLLFKDFIYGKKTFRIEMGIQKK